MRVVLAGASGLIGQALRTSLLVEHHDVTTLVRRAAGADEARWDPVAGELDPGILAGADAVICLSGAGVADHRWNDSYKQTLLASRLDSVGTIVRTLAGDDMPRVLISASAVGYYGDTGDREVDESAAPGAGFLADLCVQWEAATAPAQQAGVRVATLRTGIVLTRQGGLLAQLVPIAKLGVAGRLGSGRQFMPWISLADEIGAIRFLLDHDVHGPVNLVGPAPVRNAAFMAALGRELHRPTVIPTPAFALRLVLGELAGDAVTGQRAVPAALSAAGYSFEHSELEPALQWALAH